MSPTEHSRPRTARATAGTGISLYYAVHNFLSAPEPVGA